MQRRANTQEMPVVTYHFWVIETNLQIRSLHCVNLTSCFVGYAGLGCVIMKQEVTTMRCNGQIYRFALDNTVKWQDNVDLRATMNSTGVSPWRRCDSRCWHPWTPQTPGSWRVASYRPQDPGWAPDALGGRGLDPQYWGKWLDQCYYFPPLIFRGGKKCLWYN